MKDYLNILFNIITEKNLNNEQNEMKKLSDEKLIEKLYSEGISKNLLVFNTEENNLLFRENGTLSNIGQALLIMDQLTNNNLHILYMAISLKFSSYKFNYWLFKILLILICLRQQYLLFTSEGQNISNLEIILNRKYDKTQLTLLLKCIEQKNKKLTEFLANDYKYDSLLKMYTDSLSIRNINQNLSNNISKVSNRENKDNSIVKGKFSSNRTETNYLNNFLINIYETSKLQENVLHYAIKVKDKFYIDYFIKIDADKNILKNMKDNTEKTAQDYDITKEYSVNFTHIWEAARLNDINILEKVLGNGFYKINDQSPIFKNTALHVAASNMCDRAALFLVKNNCDIEIKNNRNLTALDCASYTANKNFIKKFKMIINKEICEFIDLENFNKNIANKNYSNNASFNGNSIFLNNSLFSNFKIPSKAIKAIKEKIQKGLEETKLNLKDIFEKVDENKNGNIYFH